MLDRGARDAPRSFHVTRMRMEETSLPGVMLLHGEGHEDERGRTRKVLSLSEVRAAGLEVRVDQVLTTDNPELGTVRGLHYQVHPYQESKTIWVSTGALYDVLLDVRAEQATYGTWMAVELRAQDDVALHVPAGVAHGYQTLASHTSLTYLIAGTYSPPHARTILWNDPTLAITWPLAASRVSDSDRAGTPWTQR